MRVGHFQIHAGASNNQAAGMTMEGSGERLQRTGDDLFDGSQESPWERADGLRSRG